MKKRINLIKRKYCTNEKVQVMLPSSNNAILLSANELLHYKDNIAEIYKYTEDKDRDLILNSDEINDKDYIKHLFHFDDIYVYYSDQSYFKEKSMPLIESSGEALYLSMFKKNKDGTALTETCFLSDFDYQQVETVTDSIGVNKFLYENNENNSKIILTEKGIEYAFVKQYGEIVNKYDIGLSDEDILKKYNEECQPIISHYNIDVRGNITLLSDEEIKKQIEDTTLKKQSAKEITNYPITSTPTLISICDNDITISLFNIVYISTNKYQIFQKRYYITKEQFQIYKLNNTENLNNFSFLPEVDEEIDNIEKKAFFKKVKIKK